MKISKRDQRCMELLNLTYEELQAEKVRIRLESVANHVVVFVDYTTTGSI